MKIPAYADKARLPIGELLLSRHGSLGIIIDSYHNYFVNEYTYIVDWLKITQHDAKPTIGLQYDLIYSQADVARFSKRLKKYIGIYKVNPLSSS